MAPNKFATRLHRSVPKFIVILVYAVLEWTLIMLLLLNSLFSYLITKFSKYFGLKPPCPLCTCRVEHILERGKSSKSYTDDVCEMHATEISYMCYCLNHKKLAKSHNMCGNCLASQPNFRGNSTGMPTSMAFVSWLSENKLEKEEKLPCVCSCCSESLNSKLYSPSSPFEPSWGSLEYAKKGNSTIEYQGTTKPDSLSTHSDNGYEMETTNEEHEDDRVADEHQFSSDVCSSSFRGNAEEDCPRSGSTFLCHETDANADSKAGSRDIIRSDSNSMKLVHQSSDASATTIQCCFGEDYSLEIIPLPSENGMVCALNHRLIPIELIDFSTRIDQGILNAKEEHVREHDHQEGSFDSEPSIGSRHQLSGQAALFMINKSSQKTSNGDLESLEKARGFSDNSSVVDAEEGKQDLVCMPSDQVVTAPGRQKLFVRIEEPDKKEPNDPPASEEESTSVDHILSRSLAHMEVSDHATDQPQAREGSSSPCFEIPNVPDTFMAQNDNVLTGIWHEERATLQGETSMLEKAQEEINHSCMCSEPNEPEEENFPATPTSVNSLGYLHKKLDEKKESAVEEYLDGSVVSEMEVGDPVATIGRLKAVLTAERKALSSLYAELEEERSASAIAANQTMAMITRLQEEKAAMQMEALQYQRMMEEQSEYDQDALQLLNELMNKKEKEKQELEKEVEVYQKKVLDYEEKEKMRTVSRIKYGSVRSRNSSASCSHSWDSDALSIDLNSQARDEDSGFGGQQESSNHNTTDEAALSLEEIALDCVKNMSVLDESLAGFEEERLSILDQLKALEEKLITLGENEEFSEDVKSIEHSSTCSVKDFEENHDFSSPEENGISNGFSKDQHHPERQTLGSMAKRLLPLLDATDNETEEGLMHEEQAESESTGMQNSFTSFELHDNKIAIEEEVDHVYERLQALEADREFLKHCMGSIKKGDKGVDLLQEILQHLKDLRVVELRVKNLNDPEGEVALD
ncbi:myosin-binding protein 3 isoform X1 [Prunus dulcis]|uniref:myosin-binding protein 3 isoform X1 n=1 Tax=Prunus dulcis TaxID=3755 RepID=UPI001482802E|nr:myosin-binding protein 3 isoform X1 [Prunus dulcis]XP_034210447.1 myosin-binding protein 3 isoform X1 [Prunus dulcis]